MINRRFILASLGLAGLLEGQARRVPVMSADDSPEHKPANNECPVCGTIAAPFKLPPRSIKPTCPTMGDDMGIAPNPPMATGIDPRKIFDCSLAEPTSAFVSCKYTEKLVRCKFCNNAFWQTAERK